MRNPTTLSRIRTRQSHVPPKSRTARLIAALSAALVLLLAPALTKAQSSPGALTATAPATELGSQTLNPPSALVGRPPSPGPTTGRGPSLGASCGHAAAGFALGHLAGAAVGAAITAPICEGDICGYGFLYGLGVGALAGPPAGAALAVWGYGEAAGGTGNFFASLAGAYLGGGIGAGLGGLFVALDGMGLAVTVAPALGIGLSMLGAVAGYHLTSDGSHAESERPTTVAIPTLGPTEDGQGAMLGAAGIF